MAEESPAPPTRRPFWTGAPASRRAGCLAGLAVVLTLGDPGLTIDEPLDVRPGRTYVATLRARGWHFFDREVVDRVFRDNAEHPPLGRWLLGIASTLGEPFEIMRSGPDPVGLYVLSARLAPAWRSRSWWRSWRTRPAGVTAGRGDAPRGSRCSSCPRLRPRPPRGARHVPRLFWTAALLTADRALTVAPAVFRRWPAPGSRWRWRC